MKKRLSIILLTAIHTLCLGAQNEIPFKRILETYASTTSIQYDCVYSIDYPAPYTSSMSVKLTRNLADSVCSFSYLFDKRLLTN